MLMKIVPVRARSAWRGVLLLVCCAAQRLTPVVLRRPPPAAAGAALRAHILPRLRAGSCPLTELLGREQFNSLFSGDPMGVPALNPCTMKNSSYYVW